MSPLGDMIYGAVLMLVFGPAIFILGRDVWRGR